jgi:hypothetical protein
VALAGAAVTREEAEQRVEDLRAQVNATPTPADVLGEAVADTVAVSLAAGDFVDRLRADGWALVRVGDGSCPDAPSDWAEEALNLMDPGWIDPLALIEELWRAAWTAGNRVASATPGVGQ